MFGCMAIGAECETVIGIEYLGQQFVYGDDMMHIQAVGSPTLSGLSAAPLATEGCPVENIAAEPIIQRRIVNHELDVSQATTPVGISMSASALSTKLAIAVAAARHATVRTDRIEVFFANTARDVITPPLRLRLTIIGAVFRNPWLIRVVEVIRVQFHRLVTSLARMLSRILFHPREGSLRSDPGSTTHAVHSSIRGLVSKAGEFRESYGDSYGNPEPSPQYTEGRCRDYRRGRAPLITGKSARRESEEIVRYSVETRSEQSSVQVRHPQRANGGFRLRPSQGSGRVGGCSIG